MLNNKAAIELQAASSLGHAPGSAPAPVVQTEGLRVVEEPGLSVMSLRRSRIQADEAWLGTTLTALGLDVPAGPRQMSGDAQLACAQVEPHCWYLTGAEPVIDTAGEGWLVSDLSARFCILRILGDAAADVLASGGNLKGLNVGMTLRLPFAESVNVLLQRFADDEFRLIVDVSFGPFVAEWLTDAASHPVPN